MTQIITTSEIIIDYVQHMGSDEMLAHAAWVSTNGSMVENLRKSEDKGQGVKGVLRYLMLNRHGTPFEHGALTVYVHAPIFVWREWHRHRIGFSYNEESARYHQLEPVFYLPPEHRPMFKVDNWKPGSPKFQTIINQTYEEFFDGFCKDKTIVYQTAYDDYVHSLENGFDPGLARDGLPVGIYSSCYVTCNPRSIMHFLSLRTHEPKATNVSYPLYEIEVAARKLEAIFAKYWPITYEEFCASGRVAP